MDRLTVLCAHVLGQTRMGAPLAATALDGAGKQRLVKGDEQSGTHQVTTREMKQRNRQLLVQAIETYRKGVDGMNQSGTFPALTFFDIAVLQTRAFGGKIYRPYLEGVLDHAEATGTLAQARLLPGPLQYAETREERMRVIEEVLLAETQGRNMYLWAEYQQKYGDKGLGSNIVVPVLHRHGFGSNEKVELRCRAIIADAEDSKRISRLHVLKSNFEPLFLSSVISTTENEHARNQRGQLAEAFLPLSSLAQILPVSFARAKGCSDKLAEAAESGQPVDMSDFFLHEAQAQLQLALLGASEDAMEAVNRGIRMTFMGHPDAPIGKVGEALGNLMTAAKEDTSLALPSDGCPVRGPVTRAIQVSEFDTATNFGNALFLLFAGHDTTGHAMTWLLFELARNPQVMSKLQSEVDAFYESLQGRDPTYRDLSKLEFMDRCITETLRLWNSVPNGTFRQLQFEDTVKGPGDSEVVLPKGMLVNVGNWSRHRNPDLWGSDADVFNPEREFQPEELARVGCPMAAANPQSERFSPFAHSPRNCVGRNFAQMEMRLIVSQLLLHYDFSLAPPYDALMGASLKATISDVDSFRGVNKGTMGPLDLRGSPGSNGSRVHTTGLLMCVQKRCARKVG